MWVSEKSNTNDQKENQYEELDDSDLFVKDGIALSIINACSHTTGYVSTNRFCSQNVTKSFAINMKKN